MLIVSLTLCQTCWTDINTYNFLKIGPIFNPLTLLELSQSPLFTQHISFIFMLNMLNSIQKIHTSIQSN